MLAIIKEKTIVFVVEGKSDRPKAGIRIILKKPIVRDAIRYFFDVLFIITPPLLNIVSSFIDICYTHATLLLFKSETISS